MYSFDCSSWHCFYAISRKRNLASSLLFVASTALVALVELNAEAKELPSSPINLTIEEIFSTAAVLKWTVVSVDVEEKVASGSGGHFQLIIQRVSHPSEGTNGPADQQMNGHSSRIIDVPGIARSFLIQSLIPDTVYRVYAAAINDHGRSNLSDAVDFQTLLDGAVHLQQYQMHSAEIAIIVFILSAWLCAVGLFLHKWRRIRILPPREPRFKHHPKNLDTIKVVKRPTDSVIYKSYTKQISTTMQARQKKLERMSTMPNIKVTAEGSSPDGARKSGRSSTLFTLTETNRDGLRSSASGPATFEMFEQLLQAAPPSTTHLLQAESPVDGTRTKTVDGESVGGRKRVSSDSEVIRMAKESTEVRNSWARNIAGNAARVAKVRTNWERDSAAKSAEATITARKVNEGSTGIEAEHLSLCLSKQETIPIGAGEIRLVLTSFEEDSAVDDIGVTDFCRPSDYNDQTQESFEMLSSNSTNWGEDDEAKEITNDIAQTSNEHLLGDKRTVEIKVTQLSGIWAKSDLCDGEDLFTNCDSVLNENSSRAIDFNTRLDEDAGTKALPNAESITSISCYSGGADHQSSFSVNGDSSADSS